jgi:hypothetical protein
MAVVSKKIPAPDRVAIRRALLSVSDKTGLIELAREFGARCRDGVDGRHEARRSPMRACR